jgi:hypothetical protein
MSMLGYEIETNSSYEHHGVMRNKLLDLKYKSIASIQKISRLIMKNIKK